MVQPSWVRGLLLLAGVLLAGPALASEPRQHDGTYLRLLLGASSLHVARVTETEGVHSSLGYPVDDSTIAGTALTAEIAAGYTPFRGVALTGLLLAHVLSPADLTLVDGSPIALGSPYGVILLAPGVDVFANPERGLHLSLALGVLFAHASIDDGLVESIGGFGAGGTMTLGYDAWVADEWSVGASLRGLFGGVVGEETSRGTTATEKARVTSVGLGITLLHH